MARVTIEDCLLHVKNRFELVLVASKRARELMLTGVEPSVEWDNDKSTVVALREIAKGTVSAKILDEAPVARLDPAMLFDIGTEQTVAADTAVSSEDELFVVASPATEEMVSEAPKVEESPANLLSVDAD